MQAVTFFNQKRKWKQMYFYRICLLFMFTRLIPALKLKSVLEEYIANIL